MASVMDSRKLYTAPTGTEMPLIESDDDICVSVAAPILSEGDILGCVVFAAKRGSASPTEVQIKLATAVASFLGKQMEC